MLNVLTVQLLTPEQRSEEFINNNCRYVQLGLFISIRWQKFKYSSYFAQGFTSRDIVASICYASAH